MQIETDHQIIAVGPTGMRLLDCQTKQTLVIATATGCCGAYKWTIHSDGLEDVTVDNRADAIGAMIDHALESGDGAGYSTLVPHGLINQP